MSVLALQLPARERLGARAGAAEGGAALKLPTEWAWALSHDGKAVASSGTAAPALLPRADHVVLVLAETDVSWHRVDIPKAPAARLRAALLGVMEEALLDDEEALHFALAAGASPGQNAFVAVTHGPRLAAALAALEGAGLSIERVVAAAEPAEAGPGHGHFFAVDEGPQAVPWLTLARADGVASLRLSGALARTLLPEAGAAGAAGAAAAPRFTATPAAAAAAERWLGAPVALLTEPERLLAATQGRTNLRQFDLVARHRGTRALREAAKRLLSAEWRPVRYGLAALLLLNLVGLNAVAWQQQQAVEAKRAALTELLKATHPGVRTVLNAPAQMLSETERLRAAAGRPGDADFESLLGAAAAAWPDGQGPMQALRYEGGKLSISAAGFGEPQLAQLRERLKGGGFTAEISEGRVTVSRVPLFGTKRSS